MIRFQSSSILIIITLIIIIIIIIIITKEGALNSFDFFTEKLKMTPTAMVMNMMIEININNNNTDDAMKMMMAMIDIYNYRPDRIMIRQLMKGIIREPFTFKDIDSILDLMDRYDIHKDVYIYGQLLLACKFKNNTERAKVIFKELLQSTEVPSSFCHNLFSEIVGIDVHDNYVKNYGKK